MKVVTTKAVDEELVAGLRSGDNRVIGEIYRKFFPAVKGNIKNWGGTEDDTKDVFQEAVLVLYRMTKKSDFKLNASFFSLLYPICRNLWYKTLRKGEKIQVVGELPEEGLINEGEILEMIHERAVDKLFRKQLGNLGEQCRKLLDLFFEGRSMKEITSRLGLSSVSFAKKKKFQCKEKLVRLVQADPIFRELKH